MNYNEYYSDHQECGRLVLGTAQFGARYGIANKEGKPDFDTVKNTICEAWENGVREFDTAQGYGDSESVLGKAFLEIGTSVEAKVISKLAPELDHLDAGVMSKALDRSLKDLGVSSLYGLLLHREELLLLWDNGLSKILKNFVASGRVKNLGVSVYSPEKAIEALNTEGIDIVQLPTNILDRRFERAGVFRLAEEKKKGIYIRSVFLQGLILMDAGEIPGKMVFAKPVIEKIGLFSRDLKLARHELALGYIKLEMPFAKIVFGADSPGQVKENMACWEKELPSSLVPKVKGFFDDIDERILNPVLWPE